LGEPLTKVDYEGYKLSFPVGQADAYNRVWNQLVSKQQVERSLCREYWEIMVILNNMAIDYAVPLLRPKPQNRIFLEKCQNNFGFQMVQSGIFPPQILAYPRNLCATIKSSKLILLNSRAFKKPERLINGWNTVVSPYGDGGYVISKNATVIIGKMITHDLDPIVTKIQKTRIGIFPSVVNYEYSKSCDKPDIIYNNHIDRVACLLKDPREKIHLVIDPQLVLASYSDKNTNDIFLLEPYKALKLIKKTFEPIGIKVHWPKSIEIPCSLNLIQFEDGRVLMTGGEHSLREVVSSIVGTKNVFETRIPIEFLPVWKRAGIHCLLSEIPDSVLTLT